MSPGREFASALGSTMELLLPEVRKALSFPMDTAGCVFKGGKDMAGRAGGEQGREVRGDPVSVICILGHGDSWWSFPLTLSD